MRYLLWNVSHNLINGIVYFLTITLYQSMCFAQCIDSISAFPTSFYNETSVGSVGWGSMSNVQHSDNSYSFATALFNGDTTNYLVTEDFNFSIPPSATICGIKAIVERSGAGLFQTIEDLSIKLVKGGVISGDEASVSTVWPSSDVTSIFGNSDDAWGEAWAASDINSSNFGIAIAVKLDGVVLPTANIDFVELTVFYSNPLPVELISFESNYTAKGVINAWNVASEINNSHYSIERKTNEEEFRLLATIQGEGNSNIRKEYFFLDETPPQGDVYYRLKQTDFDGKFKYLQTNHVSCQHKKDININVYPNPTSNELNFNITNINKNYNLKIYTKEGVLVLHNTDINSINRKAFVSELPDGVYFYFLHSGLETNKGAFIKTKRQ